MPETLTIDDAWILSRRGPRNRIDPARPYAHLVEPERQAKGTVEDVGTIFITNRECPFRCLMCDLWKNTTTDRLPVGQVAGQVEWALAQMPVVDHLKLYNSGNFFDEKAISREDRGRIATRVAGHRTVIVECHPKLVDERCAEFSDALDGSLNVAMGLETADPDVLPRLNKRMTLDDFARATEFLVSHAIPVRAFILLRTPFQSEAAGVEWAMRTIDYAFSIGVECCAVVPTRVGNGAMESLRDQGLFESPSLASIEAVLDYGVGLKRGRVFMDLWDIEHFFDCTQCGPARAERIGQINRTQSAPPRVSCECGM